MGDPAVYFELAQQSSLMSGYDSMLHLKPVNSAEEMQQHQLTECKHCKCCYIIRYILPYLLLLPLLPEIDDEGCRFIHQLAMQNHCLNKFNRRKKVPLCLSVITLGCWEGGGSALQK